MATVPAVRVRRFTDESAAHALHSEHATSSGRPGPAACGRAHRVRWLLHRPTTIDHHRRLPGGLDDRRSVDRPGPRPTRQGQRGAVHRRLHRADQIRKHHPARERQRRPRRANRSPSATSGFSPAAQHRRPAYSTRRIHVRRPSTRRESAIPRSRPSSSQSTLPNDCAALQSLASAHRSPASSRSPGSRRRASMFRFRAVSRCTAPSTTARWPASTTARSRSTSPNTHRRSTSRCSPPPNRGRGDSGGRAANHRAQALTLIRAWSAALTARGPASVATTMSSRRIPQRPGR